MRHAKWSWQVAHVRVSARTSPHQFPIQIQHQQERKVVRWLIRPDYRDPDHEGLNCRQRMVIRDALTTRRCLSVHKQVGYYGHDEANKYSVVFFAELPNGLQIAGLNSGTLVDRADVRQSTTALRIRRLYVSPAQHPRTGRNVCDCELPLSRMRRRHRARNKSARMPEMWQALAAGLGTNSSWRSEQGKALSPT